MATVKHTQAILKAVKKSGIRASVGKCLMDDPKYCPDSLCENTNYALEEAVDLFNKWNGQESDRIRVSFAPRFAISCTENLLRQVTKFAQKHSALIHTHASENQKEIEIVKTKTGFNNIEYLKKTGLTQAHLVLAHCVWPKEKELKILAKEGIHVVHCPSSNLKLASGIAPIVELKKLGINIALGADGAPCNNNLNIFNEMRLAALIHKPRYGPKVLRAQEILDMATIGGAKALNWFDQIGSIEVGKKADLVALNLNAPENFVTHETSYENIASSIVYSSQPQHVIWTMVDGKMVYHR